MSHDDLHRWQMIAAGLYECRECGTEFNLIKRKPKERPICTRCAKQIADGKVKKDDIIHINKMCHDSSKVESANLLI